MSLRFMLDNIMKSHVGGNGNGTGFLSQLLKPVSNPVESKPQEQKSSVTPPVQAVMNSREEEPKEQKPVNNGVTELQKKVVENEAPVISGKENYKELLDDRMGFFERLAQGLNNSPSFGHGGSYIGGIFK